MRMLLSFAAPLLALATASSSTTANADGVMLDPSREFHQSVDCHNAYDRLVADMQAGAAISPAAREWAVAHEGAANAGTPCAPPLPEMIARGGNWYIRTIEGRDTAAAFYHKQKDPAALSDLGIAWLNGTVAGGSAQDGLEMINEASKLGDPVALFTMGTIHASGSLGATQDYARAFELLSQSAAAGHIDAIYRVGLHYHEGLGVKRDYKKAFEQFRAAAERGHFYAIIMAFDMINSGRGAKQDFALAYRLSRTVAEQGEAYGAVMAASSLLQMKDPLKHEDEILYWIELGIEKGDENIRTKLIPMREQVIAAFTKAKAPPQYVPRAYKACPMKTVCTVNHFSGLQSCTTNKDYWSDCDG
ncbi:sel1 repeat family protein [Sphingopyxis sp. YF1]|uniref:tetratricopeptide repeat protein n=1 Tax=Sphingopyxis sp. YF1 TaxID=2482763 RepID=UPI001F60E2F1|nr:tetratricopeptide repeat protein [Sphingopyxis sp. YF1]UNU43400.1 sel1 repeat family protein [Sphingopyxis sp. YF1]